MAGVHTVGVVDASAVVVIGVSGVMLLESIWTKVAGVVVFTVVVELVFMVSEWRTEPATACQTQTQHRMIIDPRMYLSFQTNIEYRLFVSPLRTPDSHDASWFRPVTRIAETILIIGLIARM